MALTRVPLAHKLSCTREEACAATGIAPEDLDKEIAAGRIWTATIGRNELVIVASVLQLLADMAQPAPLAVSLFQRPTGSPDPERPPARSPPEGT
jgi:hypothetical protein